MPRKRVITVGVGKEESAFLGNFHDGGSRASPAHGIRITTLTGLLDWLASYMAQTFPERSPDSDEGLAGSYC